MIITTLGAAVASCALAGAPAPGHGIYSEITSGVPLTNGNLRAPKPYPDNRTSTTTYTNGGRLWTPYTAQEKILSSLQPGGGPATIGAPLYPGHDVGTHPVIAGGTILGGDAVIFVRPQSEPWPDIAISPYQTINEDTIDLITRRRPWLVRSPERTENLIDELRAAQRRFLRQYGYVASVRTHVNPLALRHGAEDRDDGSVEPSATIRLRPARPNAPKPELRTSLPGNDGVVTRVSVLGQRDAMPQITVVRQETEPESGAGDQG